MTKKLLIICGPTATGKTTLAARLAKRFDAELVSADSRQVYQGMDIGTGKDQPHGAKIHLLDVAKPDEKFNISQYVVLASGVIKKIWQKGKLPILVGGTGFYIKALVDGIETMGVPPDWSLREELEKYSISRLQARLKEIGPEKWQKMNQSDRSNPRRLIRAIEVAQTKPMAVKERLKIDKVLFIGLKAPYKILYQRIDQRVKTRIKQGVVEEIKQLLAAGYSWPSSVLGETIGYYQFQPYFEDQAGLAGVIQRWQFDEHAYARRQLTWFKKDKRTKWFDITQPDFEKKVVKLVRGWYI